MSTGHQENWEAVCAAAGLMPTAPPELVVQAIRSRALEDLAQELTAAVEVIGTQEYTLPRAPHRAGPPRPDRVPHRQQRDDHHTEGLTHASR